MTLNGVIGLARTLCYFTEFDRYADRLRHSGLKIDL